MAIGVGDCSADVDLIAQLLGNLIGSAMAYGDARRLVTVTSEAAPIGIRMVHNQGTAKISATHETMFALTARGA